MVIVLEYNWSTISMFFVTYNIVKLDICNAIFIQFNLKILNEIKYTNKLVWNHSYILNRNL